MAQLIGLLVWSVAAYFIAKKVGENYPELKVNPVYYAIGAFLLSIAGVMSFLGYRVAKLKNNLAGQIVTIVIMVLLVLFNIMYIL